MIAQETIDRVRQDTNLAELIGESVKLERRGRSLVGLCPFHQEKSPSFHVNEDRGFYHCFGCKASGDAIKFVQQTEGLEFLEAIRRLAERLGIEVVDDLSNEQRRQRAAAKRREQSMFDVNATAATYFEKMLVEHPQRGFALEELKRRGLPYDGPAHEVLQSFRVGYAPEGWDGLAQHLRRVGLDLQSAEQVGLLAPRRSGSGHYDRFRHRLMFAVVDLQGRVVAFSGRALEPVDSSNAEETPAKYINSPESPIYKKRGTVFGLYQARQALRNGEPCLLVEGNFDVVALHSRGGPGAVAPLGTAFTADQGKLIRRFTSNVTFMFDGDSAGRKAVIASREAIREADLSARVATLPDGSDPDDFSRERGEEGVRSLVRSARGMLNHLIEEELDASFAAADAQGRAERVRRVTELLASEDDPSVRALAEQHADYIASRLGVADARTFRALRDTVRTALQKPREKREGSPRLPPPHLARSSGRAHAIASEIVGTLLDFPELLDTREVLAYAEHVEGDLAAAFSALHRAGAHGTGPSHLERVLSTLPASFRADAEARLAAPRHQDVDVARAELLANLNKIGNLDHRRRGSEALGEIERASRAGDFDQELELLREHQRRARERRGL